MKRLKISPQHRELMAWANGHRDDSPRITRPSACQLQKQCDKFNATVPVGTAVTLRTDTKGDIATKTRSAAEVLSGHSAVVWLEGVSGCYALDRVTVQTA